MTADKPVISPLRLFLLTAASAFAAEALVMLTLPALPLDSLFSEAFVDALLLVAILLPFLFLWLYKPLVKEIHTRIQAENDLRSAHAELERLVAIRTADLSRAHAEISLTAQVFDNAEEGIVITDPEGNIQRTNSSFTRITGYDGDEVRGKNPRLLKSGHHQPEFYARMWADLKEKGSWHGEIFNRRKNGEVYPEWLSISAIRDDQGQVSHYVGVFSDISELKRTEAKLKHQAYHDALTGLPNRLLFLDRLNMALHHAGRNGEKVAVLFLDLDNFKNINDSLGHNFGDLFLLEVAGILRRTCRQEDTIARLGGDEFVILMPGVEQPEGAISLAKRLFAAFAQPLRIRGNTLHAGCSMGITFYPDDGDSPEVLLKNADLAMYRAKESGKHNYQIFAAEMHNRVSYLFALENRLRLALTEGQLVLHYQPKVDIVTGGIRGVEALLRWRQEDGSLVPPGDFIPLAESTGLIVPMGEWVLATACRQTKFWHDRGYPLQVAVNLSCRQFMERDLVERMLAILTESGLPAPFLELEITESLLMQNRQLACDILGQFKRKGIKVTIDDFGTGYSSLAYLSKLPIDALKIDRAFIRDLPENEDDATITRAVITLAKGLKLETVAEGVETVTQLQFLRPLGCDMLQGFLFSRPLAAEALEEMLRAGRTLTD